GLPGDEAAAAASLPIPEETVRNLRIELGEVDALLQQVSAISAQCAAVQAQLSAVRELPIAARRAADALETLAGGIDRLTGHVRQLRLAPAATLVVPLERAVRDAAISAGVSARLTVSGGEHRLDADVLASVRDALIQAVRNAVAHGIE